MKQLKTRYVGLGLFSVGWVALGGLCLTMGDFLLQYEPVPGSVARFPLAIASALLLIACGLGLVPARTRKIAAMLLLADLLVWMLVLQPPAVLKAPDMVVTWLPFFELGALLSGALAIASETAAPPKWPSPVDGAGARLAQVLFSLCCFAFAASHFTYPAATAAFIPEWIPDRLFLAYLTGAGHLCAGVAILTRVQAKLAAVLEAAMMSSFVLLVHVPSLFLKQLPFWAPNYYNVLMALFIATSLSGAAWLVAASIKQRTSDRAAGIPAIAV
jgi:uncharacterized membrane protein